MPSFCPRWRMLLFCTDERFHVKLFYIYIFPLVATIYRVSMYVRVRDADCSSFGCRMTMLSSRVLIVEWVLLPRCLRILCKYNIHSLDEDTDTDKDTHLSRFPLKWRRQTHVSVHEWGGEKEIIHFWFVIVFLLLVNFCIYGLREREKAGEGESESRRKFWKSYPKSICVRRQQRQNEVATCTFNSTKSHKYYHNMIASK